MLPTDKLYSNIPGLRYNIKGSVATSRAMPTPFYLSIKKLVCFGPSGFMYILIIASCTPENPVNPLNNMHADTLGAEPFVLSREAVLYKN